MLQLINLHRTASFFSLQVYVFPQKYWSMIRVIKETIRIVATGVLLSFHPSLTRQAICVLIITNKCQSVEKEDGELSLVDTDTPSTSYM